MSHRQIYFFDRKVPIELLLETMIYKTFTAKEVKYFTVQTIILDLTLNQAIAILNEYYTIYNLFTILRIPIHGKTKCAIFRHIREIQDLIMLHHKNYNELLDVL